MDVSTINGDIVVLLPPTFGGTVSVRQWRPALNLLPAFSARKSTVRTTAFETDMALDRPGSREGASAVSQRDRCSIITRTGRVTVGVSGIDRHDEPQREGGMLRLVEDVMHLGMKLVEERLAPR